MGRKMKNFINRYIDQREGQFGTWIAVAAFPVLLMASLAVDFNGAEKTRVGLKTALDSAALAAVTHQNLTEVGRQDYAVDYFNQNFPGSKSFQLKVESASNERVKLSAYGQAPVTIGRAAGIENLPILESSTAVLTKENIICVLTLNPDGDESFMVSDASAFLAPTCSVQVNSTGKKAASVDAKSMA